MTDYEIDRWAHSSGFSIAPSEHGADRMEFLDFDVDEIKYEPVRDETISAGVGMNAYREKNIKTTMTFGKVRVVRLWSDGEPIETVGLITNDDFIDSD